MEPTEKSIAEEHPFGYIEDNKVFLKPYLSYPSREIGAVKETPSEAIAYFENRFKQFEKKVDDLFEAIEKAENKGSFLQKLLHLKELCGQYDGLGDFTSIFARLEEKEAYLSELINKNRVKNLAQKKALLQELEVLRDSNDWINASEKIKEIKNKWIRIGSVEKVVEDEVEQMFKEYLDVFFKRRQEFYDERNQLNAIKLKKYEELADKAFAIKDSIDFRKTIEEFKRIKEEWKQVGPVPKKDLFPIYKKYKDSNDYFFRKVKANKRRREQQQMGQGGFNRPGVGPSSDPRLRNFERLLSDLEKLAAEMPFQGDEQVRKLQEDWKKSMPVRSDDYKRLERKFRSLCVKTLDTYFVNKIAYKRNPNIKKLPPKEQLKIQIGVLKELIARDKEQIENFENNFTKLEVNAQPNSFDKVFGSKLDSQKRNLESKQNLLKEFEEKLIITP